MAKRAKVPERKTTKAKAAVPAKKAAEPVTRTVKIAQRDSNAAKPIVRVVTIAPEDVIPPIIPVDYDERPSVMGRPRVIRKEDEEQVIVLLRRLGRISATAPECAAALDIAESTLWEFFKRRPDAKDAWLEGQNVFRVSLRRKQAQNAMENNSVAMQIWLGKQHLGQREPVEISGGLDLRHSPMKALLDDLDLNEREAEAARMQGMIATQPEKAPSK